MRHHAILFDIDGTLLNSTPAFSEIMLQSCQQMDWPTPPDDMMRQLMTFRRDPIEMLFGELSQSEYKQRQTQLHETAQMLWKPLFDDLARPFDDAIDVLNQFQNRGFRLGIVTDSNHEIVQHIIGQPGCPEMDVIITRDESGVRKPDPKPMLLALEGIGLEADSVIYIGDNPGDVEAGAAVGMAVIGITTGPSCRQDLEQAGAVAVVDSLTELVDLISLSPAVISGSLTGGLGVAADFTSTGGVKPWITKVLGQPAFPGTINLTCSAATAAVVKRHRNDPSLRKQVLAGGGLFCDAHFHSVTLSLPEKNLHTSALLMWPEVPEYPGTKLELICCIGVRDQWQIADGQCLQISYIAHTETD
ncbi:MAG: HAD-IA family hydrolase [Immundisolibacteraceae bacterium]|nr:HAD-IA family hydrolase [Immundisolibacteraceae bacterium]